MLRALILCALSLIPSMEMLAQEESPAKSSPVDAALARERAGDFETSLKLLGEEIERNPQNGAAHFHRGRIGFNALRFQPELQKQVEGDFDRALELRPNEATWRTVRAEFFAQTNRPDKAVEDLTEALKLRPGQPQWLLQRGLAHSQLGKLKEAAADNEAAARIKPDFAFAWINATDVYVRLGDAPNAIRTGDQAVKVAAKIPMAQLNCGRAYFLDNRLAVAEERFNSALQLIPNFPQALFYRAELYSLLDDLAAARNDYYLVALLGPNDVQSRMLFARTERLCGNYESALQVLDALRKVAPDEPELQYELALAWAAAKEPEKALAALEVIKDDERFFADIQTARGDVLWQQGELAAAQEAYWRVRTEYDLRIAAAPDDPIARLRRGLFLLHQRTDAEALEDFRIALEKSPRDFEAANSLAWLLATTASKKVSNPDDALRLAKQACEITLNRRHGHLDTMAAALAATGAFDEAVKVQKKAIALATPENVIHYQRRLACYSEHKQWQETSETPKFVARVGSEPLDLAIPVAKFDAVAVNKEPAERKLAEVIDSTKDAVVLIQHESGGGSGMILSSTGHVITCAHVLPLRGEIKVTCDRTEDDKQVTSTFTADILAVDRVRDLALLRLREATKLPTVQLGLSAKVSAGDSVVVVANPLAGGKFVLKQVATDGIVSNASQTVGAYKLQKRIQTTANVSPGCSGGPLLNTRGQVIGVVVSSVDAARAGFAIPIADVKAFLRID